MRLMVLLMAQCFTMLNVCNPFIDFLLVIRVALFAVEVATRIGFTERYYYRIFRKVRRRFY